MGIFDGYLFCCDIDGTLAYEEGKVSKKNLDAIKKFTSGGGIFCIASGRYADYAEKVIGYKPQFPVIGLNGSVIYDREKESVIWKKPLSERTKEIAVEVCKNCGTAYLTVCINCENRIERCKSPDELREKLFSTESDVFKVVFVTDNAEDGDSICKYVKAHYAGAARVTRSYITLTEILEPGTGKSECMRFLRKMYPNVHTVVSAGDYENDTEFVRDADIGYAVENALPCVKAAAKRSAPKNTEDAIAYIVDELERDACERKNR